MPDGGRVITSFDIVNAFLDVAPVDLEAMAAAMGIELDMQAQFPDGSSGRVRHVSAPSPHYKIEVNARHSAKRKRFTLAHEIAHYLLHRTQIGDGITDNALYRSRLGEPLETEANRLAVELIMPANLVKTFWRSGIRSLNQLCEMFQVSEEALRIRLQQLRLAP